jgi:arsenate reductase
METPAKFKVLFLCTGNSARSVFAEYLLKQLGSDSFESHSAGSDPSGKVNPMTLKVLKERMHIDPSGASSKSWDTFMENGTKFDFVITVCDNAKESCPVWPDQPIVAHWTAPDPAAFEGTEAETERYFYQVAMLLKRRIELFLSLPFDKLEKWRLEQATRDIADQTEMGTEE